MPTIDVAAATRLDWRKVRTWVVNGTIVLLLALMILQGMPLNMNAAIGGARYTADWLGIGHDSWGMFAPEVDRQNHRLIGEIMADDGHVIVRWSTPHWPDGSTLQRFRKHRWTEYYDNVWMENNQAGWPFLARHIYRTAEIPYEGEDNQPRQVRLIKEYNWFPEPKGDRWPKAEPPEAYDQSWVLKTEPLP